MQFLGIDCGGTCITGVLMSTGGDVISLEKSTGGNASLLTEGQLHALLKGLLHQLMPDDDFSNLRYVIAGFAGAGRAGVRKDIAFAFQRLGILHVRVVSDLELAHLTFFDQAEGILVISGTGSACLFRDSLGRMQQVGGWGYALGDDGSGFSLGREAIRAALLELESGGHSSLAEFAENLTDGKSNRESLLHFVYNVSNPQSQIATSARLVCEFAERGEEWACTIIEDVSGQLFDLLHRVIAANAFTTPVPVALFGGLLQNQTPFLRAFLERATALPLEPIPTPLHPAVGGALRALESYQGKVDDAALHRLSQIVI